MVSGSKLRLLGVLPLVGAALALGQGCGMLVGIEETNVENTAGASDDAGTGGGGKGGAAGGGSSGSAGMQASGGAAGSGTSGSAGRGGSSGGGGAGKGGAGGSDGGSSGSGGDVAGKGGSSSGSAGMSQGGMPSSGGSAGSGAMNDCGGLDARCNNAGKHEICTDGAWESDPCPLDKPTCEDGACIVRGPTMVQSSSYYIDSTEVTVAQYNEFLTAKDGDTSGQSGVCGWNDDYAPGEDAGPDDWPISYVDWCDATAYCKWANKHLCGRLDGEQITLEELLIANDSQWFRACGGPSGSPHPNGDPMCNANGGFDTTAPVATFPGCEGFYPGLFDMEGNVAEWVDACDAESGAADTCYALGGSTVDSESYCTHTPDEYTRDATAFTVGFRCCSG
jgi:hypothetical protein